MSAGLYRSRDNRVIAGVCAGLAKRFDVSVGWLRLLFVLLLILFGSTLLIYLILWLLVPKEPAK